MTILDQLHLKFGYLPNVETCSLDVLMQVNSDEFKFLLTKISNIELTQKRYSVAMKFLAASEFHDLAINLNSDDLITSEALESLGLIQVSDYVFTSDYYNCEVRIHAKLIRSLDNSNSRVLSQIEMLTIDALKTAMDQSTSLNKNQLLAIINSIEEPVSIVTGGPGTGKTRVIKTMVKTFISSGILTAKDICILTPTNSAKALYPNMDCSVSTVHKALGFNPFKADYRFTSDNPLPFSLVVIDEATMLDFATFDALLCAIPSNCRIVLVGDGDQLGSVKGGDVFFDLVQINYLPLVKLVDNYRSNSSILDLLSSIEKNVEHDFLSTSSTHLISAKLDRNAYYEKLLRILLRLQNAGIDIIKDLQILSPTNNGTGSNNEINRIIHSAITPDEHPIDIGDKIIIGKTAAHFFEGEQGLVIDISSTGTTLKIQTKSNPQGSFIRSPSQPRLSHCLTIHASQGTEWLDGLICINKHDLNWIGKRGLVTAISRFKRSVTIYSDATAFDLTNLKDVHKTTLASALNYDFHLLRSRVLPDIS